MIKGTIHQSSTSHGRIYILSARWVELLGRSADHECHMGYTAECMDSSLTEKLCLGRKHLSMYG